MVVVAFGGMDGRGFRMFKWNQCSTGNNNGMKLWWGLTTIKDYWEISKRAKPKSDQRPTGLKKTFLKIEKVFQVWENITKIRDEFLGCYKPFLLKKNLVPRFGDL